MKKYEDLIDGLSENEKNYTELQIIRKFEENLLGLFGENKLFGTTHTCIGQEAIAVGVMQSIGQGDIVFSNHRCHGHFIAYSHKPELLLREIMGKQNSLCDGRGGSQHIHYKNFYTNGVQGGIVPNAVGAALTEKRNQSGNISIVFIGDGTLGQGVVYEAMNIAKLWGIPILFVVENNGYAMSTSTEDAVSGSISGRASAFGINSSEVDGNDVNAVSKATKQAVDYIRENMDPYMLICNTYRLAAHSKGDDCRPQEEILEHKKNDPIIIAGKEIDLERKDRISSLVQDFIFSITEEAEKEEYAALSQPEKADLPRVDMTPVEKQKRYLDYISIALKEAMENNDAILMGEDVRDPYGGAFKITKGLSTEYSSQVYNTPISEAAITGIAVGAALNGTKVIAEIMFGDFITLCIDQLLNHASKYGWLYREGKTIPIVLRTPMGGRRGYGPTHSQSLEKYVVGMPDVNVVVLSALHNPVYAYRRILAQNNPTVVIENKKMYTGQLLEIDENGMIEDFFVKKTDHYLMPTYLLSYNADFSNDITLITYGGMLSDCLEAAKTLMVEDEIVVNIIVLGQLSETPVKDIKSLCTQKDKVLFVEEGTFSYGIGAEIISTLAESEIGSKFGRIAAPDSPIPNSLLQEKDLLPGVNSIIEKVRSFV